MADAKTTGDAKTSSRGSGLMLRFLDLVERAGNRLPHPFWLFCYLVIAVLVLSDVLARLGTSATAPDGEQVAVASLLTADGLQWFVLHMVENFAHFEPLGLVLVMLMGVAIAEGSGLISAVMNWYNNRVKLVER